MPPLLCLNKEVKFSFAYPVFHYCYFCYLYTCACDRRGGGVQIGLDPTVQFPQKKL